MRLKALHWVVGSILSVFVVVALTLLLARAHEPSLASTDKINGVKISDDRELEILADPSQFEPIEDAVVLDKSMIDLLVACPDPAAENLSLACLQALDSYFLDKTFGKRARSLLIPESDWNALDYRRVFANPLEDRLRVFATLEKEECFLRGDDLQAHWGRNIDDRREICHAEAFTNYAQFNLICAGFRDGRDAEREWIDPRAAIYSGKTRFQHFQGAIDELFDQNSALSKKRRQEWLWAEVLEVRWLKHKCAEFDSVPGMSADRDVREYELLRIQTADNSALAKGWKSRHPRSNIYDGLVSLAGFLGDGYLTYGYRQGGEAWEELVYGVPIGGDKEEHPWRADLDRGRLDPTFGRGDRLLTAMTAVFGLQREGIEFDRHWLVESLCRESEYRGPDAERGNISCQDFFHDLRATLVQGLKDMQDTEDQETYAKNQESANRYFRVLDEFERVALELGIYDRSGSLELDL